MAMSSSTLKAISISRARVRLSHMQKSVHHIHSATNTPHKYIRHGKLRHPVSTIYRLDSVHVGRARYYTPQETSKSLDYEEREAALKLKYTGALPSSVLPTNSTASQLVQPVVTSQQGAFRPAPEEKRSRYRRRVLWLVALAAIVYPFIVTKDYVDCIDEVPLTGRRRILDPREGIAMEVADIRDFLTFSVAGDLRFVNKRHPIVSLRHFTADSS